MILNLKRVYLPEDKNDGYRVLVDRLWPRGLSKEKAAVDLWFKDIAPSNELRKWFNHDHEKWIEFKQRYHEELKAEPTLVNSFLEEIKKHRTVTLLYGAKDAQFNQAVALAEYLKTRISSAK